MIISHSLKYVFIHVPKTGGTSISNILNTSVYEPDLYVLRPFKKNEYLQTHSGSKMIQTFLDQNGYNHQEYFKFAFIRNPWDRLVSHYEYYLQNMSRQKINMARKENVRRLNLAQSSFKDFCFGVKGHNLNAYFFKNINFIGKFESLQEDMQIISDKILGYRHKVKIPHLNRTKRRNYREYYDDETRRFVEDTNAKTIEFGNYKF